MKSNRIFTFSSNLAGRHGKGSALYAAQHYGAEPGIGEGRTGRAYAIPTKSVTLRPLPLRRIRKYVNNFIDYAHTYPELEFQVTRIGCNLAGYRDEEIAPLFRGAPDNCILPEGWRELASASTPTEEEK